MSAEANAAAVRRWIDAYNNRDAEAEAAARTHDFVAHVPGAPGPLNSEPGSGSRSPSRRRFPICD